MRQLRNRMKLQKILEEYCPEPPHPDAAHQAYEMIISLPPRQQSEAEFMILQASFIRKRTWFFQILVLLGFILCIPQREILLMENGSVCLLCACAAPLLILINTVEFARIYHGGVLEMELATRYSLPKVIAARMLIFGVTDAFIMICVSIVGAWVSSTALLVMLLYCMTPFCMVCAISIGLLRKLNPTQFMWAAFATIGIVFLLLLFPLGKWRIWGNQWVSQIYTPDGRLYWEILLLAAVVLLVWQIHRFHKEAIHFIEM